MVSPKNTDWTFREISTSQNTHGLHQYPARMHPEIATRIIEKYATGSKTVILDPFMGSGGVLVEAMLHGNNSIGIDLNPFAVLLSKVKTTPLDPKKLQSIFSEIMESAKIDAKNNVEYDNAPEKLKDNMDFWYPSDPILKLPILKNHVNQIKNKDKIKRWRALEAGQALAQRATIDPEFGRTLNQLILKGDLVHSYCAYQSRFRDRLKSLLDRAD